MVKKLRMLWARKGEIDVFDLENEFYLVNFQQHDDYMDALVGGPWVIADAYLNVSRWRPEFDPKKATIDSVVAWVRLPDLPAPLFDKKFLLSLGNSIGKAIRLDVHTAQRSRGKFARMCVELDLTKPLIPEFSVKGQGGSRFNALRDDSVIEEESVGEEMVKQNAAKNNEEDGTLPEGGGYQQRSFDPNGGRGAGCKKSDSVGGGSKGKKVVEGRKGGSKETTSMNNNGLVGANRGGGVLKPLVANRGWKPEGTAEIQRKQGVQAVGKENLKPGGNSTKMRSVQELKTDESNTEMDDEDPIESVGVSMEEEPQTPKLAD
ncbi:hypothetical protein K1719_033112 [Acacia pycnantha]|nr:hypothetical protein K1719_033112 [Acacia pycnantha]